MDKTPVSLVFAALILHASAGFAWDRSDFYGEQVPESPPARTVIVSDTTRNLHVTRSEVIRLVHDKEEIVWKFDGSGDTFNLQEIVPTNISSHRIIVTISRADDK